MNHTGFWSGKQYAGCIVSEVFFTDSQIFEQFQQEYLCERVLKERENGVVWLVRRRSTGKRYVYRRYTGDGAVYEKLREVACPHLPRVEAVEQRDGEVFVLEEYIQGDDLETLLRDCLMTPEEAAEIIRQLCRALEVLHGLGAVHRDIKPSNIVVRGAEAVLIDFDAARIHKQQQSTDTRVMGTTGYAAPEQYGFAQTDARTDIYALGVLLNVMTTGQHPARVLAPGWLRKVVETSIAVHADNRYPSVRAMAQALTPPKSKKRLGVIAALALAVLIAGGVLGFLAADRSQPEPETVPEEPQPTGPLTLSVDSQMPMGGVQQLELLLHGQAVLPEQVDFIGFDNPDLGEIGSFLDEPFSGTDWDLSFGRWMWSSLTAYPDSTGNLLVTIGGEDYTLPVSTGPMIYRFYTEDTPFITNQGGHVVLYTPDQQPEVHFEVLDPEIGPITAVECRSGDCVTWELDEKQQTVVFRLRKNLRGAHSADLTVITDHGRYVCSAQIAFAEAGLTSNYSLLQCRMPGSMSFDLLLNGELVAMDRISEIGFSTPELGQIRSIPELIEKNDWNHGTDFGHWLWVTDGARPHTAGLLYAVIDGVRYEMAASTGDPDGGFYLSDSFADEAYVPFEETTVFDYTPGQKLKVWFRHFRGETILRAYADHGEFSVQLPEAPADTAVFTLDPSLTGDHNLRLNVVTSTGSHYRLPIGLLETK